MTGSSEGGDAAVSTQLTLLRAPELGEPIGDTLRGHIARGIAWGAGVVTAFALLASVMAALARPRLPAPKWD